VLTPVAHVQVVKLIVPFFVELLDYVRVLLYTLRMPVVHITAKKPAQASAGAISSLMIQQRRSVSCLKLVPLWMTHHAKDVSAEVQDVSKKKKEFLSLSWVAITTTTVI